MKRYFFNSVAFTSLILMLIIGLTIVEKNTRAIGFGEDINFLEYQTYNRIPKYVKIHFMGRWIYCHFIRMFREMG